jgi:hypothetical protein
MTAIRLCQEGRDARQSVGLQDEEQEAKEGRPALELRRDSSRGVSGAAGGSLMTAIRKPAAVNASVIACGGRSQEVIGALWPPSVHSSVRLRVWK